MADKARSEMHRKKTMAYANKSKNIVPWGDAEEKPRARRLLVYGKAFEQDKSLLKMSSRSFGGEKHNSQVLDPEELPAVYRMSAGD